MIILGVDPGEKAGWCLYDTERNAPVAKGQANGRTPQSVRDGFVTLCHVGVPVIDACVIERPENFKRKGHDIAFASLRTLISRAAYWQYAWETTAATKVAWVAPNDWQQAELGAGRMDRGARLAAAIHMARQMYGYPEISGDEACAIFIARYHATKQRIEIETREG